MRERERGREKRERDAEGGRGTEKEGARDGEGRMEREIGIIEGGKKRDKAISGREK